MLQKAYTTYLKTTLIVFSFLLFCFNHGFTQTNCLQSFQVSFGGNNDDIAYDVADAGNGQYYTVGTTKSFGAGNTDILVTKIAGDGSVVWSYAYGAGGDETVRKISATPDGGLVLTGQTKSFSQSQGEIFCMKINSGGHLDWSKRFGDKNDAFGDLGLNIIPTFDGGYAFTGIFNVAGQIGDLVIAKLDANGNITWFKRMNSNQGEDGTGLLQEGNELLVASDLDNNGTNYSSVIMRLNINTGIVVSQTEIRPAARGLFGPFLYKDKNGDGYWISGHTTDGYSYNQMQPVILKLDNNFKLVKTYSFKVPGIYTNDYFTGFTQMNNGFVVCASTQSNPTGYLFYINTDGSIKWAKKFAGTNGRSLYRLQHLGSKIIAVGKDASQGKGNDFFVEGFGDGGIIDQLCHPDTTAVTITAPAFTENNFTWSSVKNQLFDDISAPVIVSPVTITAKSLCDACPVNVIPSFTIPDTVCIGSPITINNTTTGASTYFWNFCTADINANPVATNLGSFGGNISSPVFMDIAEDNGHYYAFVINYVQSNLIKLDFGNSFLNTPTPTNLGNFGGILPHASTEGIQVIKNENKWYAIIVGGTSLTGTTSKIVKLSFGSSLSNNSPVATDWGNIGNLDFPHDLHVFQENNHWYGFTINKSSNTITRLDFTNSFENTPTGKNLGNLGNLNLPTGLYAINADGNWHVFITNSYDDGINPSTVGTLTRLDFGASLLNSPTAVNLGNVGGTLHTPRDISIINFCDGPIGFVVNDLTHDIVRLNFPNGLDNAPVGTSLGNIGNFTFAHSISKLFRVGSDVYFFVPDVNKQTITRLKFAGCNNASIPNSSAKNPPPVTYSTPGVYNINLTVDDGLPTQSSICKQVFVQDCITPVVPSFNAPDTVCLGQQVNIKNTTTGASSYFWNFCTADINQPPTGTNFSISQSKMPVYIDYVYENGNYYAFETNNYPGGLLRLDFGNSLLNTPTVTDFGNINGAIPDNTEGLQIVKNGGKWYVIVVGGDPEGAHTASAVVTVTLGTNIANNNPTAKNWGNIGNLDYPHDLYVFQDNDKWYGFTPNTNNNTITRFEFGSDFAIAPTATNLGNIGSLNGPTGLHALKDNNNKWHVFVTNALSNTITRLDFSGTLLIMPAGINLGNLGGTFNKCWDIYIMKYCGDIIAYVINAGDATLSKLDFNGNLVSKPTAVNFGNIGNMNFPHCLSKLFRVGANVYSLISNVNSNSITRLQFTGCTNASIPNSSAANPPPITYSTPGVYNINLTVDDGLPTQNSFCKQVYVAAPPSVKLSGDTVVCLGDSAHITATGGTSYSWLPTTGITNPNSASIGFKPSSSTKYYVTVKNDAGCTAKDSAFVIVSTCSVCDTWAKFTGSRSKIQIGKLDVKGHVITVEAVFNRTSSYSGGYLYAGDLVSKHRDPNDVNYLLRPNDAEITTTTGGYKATFGICEIKLNKTYHVAMVYDGTTLKFYRDGFLMSQVPATGDLIQNNYLTTIGTTAYDLNPHPTDFVGYINEVRIWNVARTQAEIKQYMNSPLPNPSSQNGLLAYYNFSSLKNRQGNSAWDGKIVNGASINQTNTSCEFIADSCGLKPGCTANPDFSFKQDACNPKLFQFTNETQNTASVTWDFGNGKKAGNDETPAITYGAYGNYNVKLFVQTTGGCIDSVSKNISVNVVNDSLIITNDTTLCNPKSLQLNAVPALNYCWSPAKGLSATDIANPMANITGNITYYVTTQSTGKNLIVNGDFSQGNTGFTSGYTYTSPKNTTEGQYNVDIDSHVWNLGMASCGDHSGNGNMMMINGNPQPDLQVWSETITVKPNTTYAFSAWLEPLHSQNPAALQFYINGKTIGSVFNAALPTCNWKQFYVTWNSGDTNKATISIINKNTILVGNDFALDDISFAESTIKTDSVVIKVGVQGVKISPDTTICSGGSAQMAAKVPGSITYKWSPATGLNNTGIANPVASPVNTTTYRVDATTINGCKITDSVKVSVLPQPAVATIADTAICNGEVIQLTTASNGSTFSWLPATGLSDPSLQNPLAKPTKNTQYIVTVNPGTLCSIKDTVNISVKLLPVVKVSDDTTLCSGASTQLTATSSGNVIYSWLPTGGLSDATINNPIANPSVTTRYNVQVKGANGCTNTDSILVTVLPQPFVNTIADTAICGGTTIQLITASNGSSYHWSPSTGLSDGSQQSPSAKPSKNTQYIVTVNPGTLCSIKDTVNITVNQSPALKVSNDTSLCNGTSTQLTAISPGNVTYSWSPAAGLDDVTVNNPVANPSATTQYNVLVTGANGCASTDSVLVTVLPQPFVKTIADTAICSGTIIQLTTASNGSTYHWSPGAGLSGASQQSPSAKPSASTQYVVTVNPGTQCSIKDTVNITVTQSPPLQVSNDTTLCSGTSVQLKAASTVNVIYSWLPDASLSDINISNPIAAPTITTKYFVQVKGVAGCFSTDSITVSVLPQPAVTAMTDTSICNGTSVRLTTSVANGNTYNWSPATGLSSASQQNPVAKPTVTTQYIITVNPGALCAAKDTVNIAVKPAPALQLSKDTTLCSGTSTQITASSPDAISYSWSPVAGLSDASAINPVASPLTTTKYFLQVTGSNGCNNTDSIVISVLPQPTVATIADTAICLGAPVALTTSATNGNTYSWLPATGLSNPSAQSPVASPTSRTQYIVTVNKGSLCTAQDTVNVAVNALPLLQASGDTILCSGASVQLNAASGNNVTYSWSPASGLNNPAVNNPVASPTAPTVYTVQVVDGNKCTAQASVTVNVIPKPVFEITPANKQICVGDPLTLTASGGDIYQWGPAETVVSPTAASTQVKPVSNTNYQVIIVNSTCKLSDTLYSSIVVTNKLTTTVTKSNDLDCVLASTTLQATGGNQYSWSPNTNINQTNIPNPVVSPLETTTYYVVIKKNGCEVKDSITVVVTPANADNAYKMASAFTPNGDGLNDCFGVKYWGGIKTFLFEVYNRWGNRLFYTTDPSKCWDGTYKGQYQPTGTYVYQIKAETICGNIYKKGTVVIIR